MVSERAAGQRRWHAADLAVMAVIGGGALALYARTLAPSVLPSDLGEYQFVLPTLGLAHPTGYPLYIVLGHLWTYLPLGIMAYRVNLLSAVISAATLVVVFAFLRRLTGSRAVAGGLAAFLGTMPLYWSQALVAGSYPLNTLLYAMLIYAVLDFLEGGRPEPVLLSYGLGLAHHRTFLLAGPAVVWVLWARRARPGSRAEAGRWLAAGLGPLLAYLYVPLRAWQLGERELTTWPGLARYLSGSVFEHLLFQGGWAGLPGQVRLWWGWLGAELTWPMAALAAAGLALGLRQRSPFTKFLALAYVGLVVFNLNYYIGNIAIYYLPGYLILVVLAAVALTAAAARINAELGRPQPWGTWLLALAVGLAAGARLVITYDDRDLSDDYALEDYWLDALAQPLEDRAAVLSTWDKHTGLIYYQRVEGMRPDLKPLIVDQAPLAETLGANPAVYAADLPGLWPAYVLGARRPLIEVRAGPRPAGEAAPAHRREAAFAGCVRLAGYDFSYLRRDSRGGWRYAATLYWMRGETAACQLAVSLRLYAADQALLAQADGVPIDGLYPPERWGPDEVVIDGYVLVMAPDGPRPASADLALVVYDPVTLEPLAVAETGETLLRLGPVALGH